MSRIWAIFAREVKSYFLSPIAWVVMTGFMALTGVSFYFRIVAFNDLLESAYESGSLEVIKQNWINYFFISPFISDTGLILMFLVPVLTMRLFSEEKRMKTEELLLTSPLTVNQIVISKYLAGLFFAIALVAGTFLHMGILFYYARPDIGATLSTYISIILFVGCAVSIGVFTSSLTENQIVASVACLILELFFATMGVASSSITNASIAKMVGYLSLQVHMRSFLDGVILSNDLIYFFSFAFLFLFLTNRSVESSRWR